MNDEIKEILEELRKTADNTVFAVCSSKEELDKIPRYTANFMSINDRKAKRLLDYITNLQQEKDTYKEQLRITHKDLEHYISRCEKAVEYIKSTTFFGLRSGKTFMSKYLNELLNILQNGSDNQ